MPESQPIPWERFETDDPELAAWYVEAEASLSRALETAEAEHNARFLAEHPPPEGRDPELQLTFRAQLPRRGTLHVIYRAPRNQVA